MSALYKVKSHDKKLFLESKQNDPSKPEVRKIKLHLLDRIRIYLTRDFTFSPLCCCFKTKLTEEYNEILERGGERMEEEMDIFNIIKKQRRLVFELE